MDEIYYVDRPAIPATKQVVVKIDALFEDSISIQSQELSADYWGTVVEVKNSRGENEGTLVYFPGVTYEELTRASVDDTELTTGDATDDVIPEPIDGPVASRDEETEVLDDIRMERILDLELDLAAAKQRVQDIEDEIADEEGALD